jgi:hypothetical protein
MEAHKQHTDVIARTKDEAISSLASEIATVAFTCLRGIPGE